MSAVLPWTIVRMHFVHSQSYWTIASTCVVCLLAKKEKWMLPLAHSLLFFLNCACFSNSPGHRTQLLSDIHSCIPRQAVLWLIQHCPTFHPAWEEKGFCSEEGSGLAPPSSLCRRWELMINRVDAGNGFSFCFCRLCLPAESLSIC